MKYPTFLKKGDRVGITATARKIAHEPIEWATQALDHVGLVPKVSPHISDGHFIFAGNDETRAKALQEMLDDPTIKAIWCARGGYGTVRVLEQLDWTAFKNRPKWLIGFSDVTNLHIEINDELQCATIHGTMPINVNEAFATDESLMRLFSLMMGENNPYEWPMSNSGMAGDTQGKLIGGNLANLAALSASVSESYFDNALLFIEDIDEYLYEIDRMLRSMKKAGCFGKINGVLVGQFTSIKDNDDAFGESLEEIILNAFAPFNIPVAFGFQAGHEQPNWPIVLGSTQRLFSKDRRWHLVPSQ